MNVVIYARYSSHNQTEQSIEGQLKVCYEYANRNNLDVIDEYIDRAVSGTSDNRPQFQQMIQDSSNKKFQGVLVYQLDRFARSKYDSVTYKHILKQNGVRVFSVKENISEDASGILMESVLEGMAEYYSVELSQKIKRGHKTNANKCYYNGGSVPLGLKLVTTETLTGHNNNKIEKKKFAIDEEKAFIVQTIFDMYANGSTMADIIRYLNEKQIKTSRGKEFNKNSLRKMLLNKKYIGTYSYDGKEIEKAIPNIIEEDIFYKVREKMLKNKEAPARAKAKEEYLLTTKLFCGTCNSMMVGGGGGTSHTGKYYRKYHCKGCYKKTISKDYIETLVAEKARSILTDEYIDYIANTMVRIKEKEKEKTRIKVLEKLLLKNEKGRANLFDSLKACDSDSIRKSIFEEISKMEEENKEIQKQIRLEEKNIVSITAKQIKYFFQKLRNGNINDIEYRQRLINVLIYKVYLYDDNITVVSTTQETFYVERVPKLSELESSLLGNQPPPFFSTNRSVQ